MPEEKDIRHKLILADGTVLNNCECGYSNKTLWCFLKDIPFSEAFQYFSGPEKFNTVIFVMAYGDITTKITYSGMEEITAVQQSEYTVDVRLEGTHIEVNREQIFGRVIDNDDDEFAQVSGLTDEGGE